MPGSSEPVNHRSRQAPKPKTAMPGRKAGGSASTWAAPKTTAVSSAPTQGPRQPVSAGKR